MKQPYRQDLIARLDGCARENDILNVLLSNAYEGRDMSGIAEELLNRFPSVGAIINASYDELILVKGVSRDIALYLKAVGKAKEIAERKVVKYIKNRKEFAEAEVKSLSFKDNEYVEIYLVGVRGKVLYNTSKTSGETGMVEFIMSDIVKYLSDYKPYGLYIAHNHVTCSCEPSASDDRTTEKLKEYCDMCGVKLLDHCIVDAHGKTYSYAGDGKLK